MAEKTGNGCDSEVWSQAILAFISTIVTLKSNTQHLIPSFCPHNTHTARANEQLLCFALFFLFYEYAPVQMWGHTGQQIKYCKFSKIQNPSQLELTWTMTVNWKKHITIRNQNIAYVFSSTLIDMSFILAALILTSSLEGISAGLFVGFPCSTNSLHYFAHTSSFTEAGGVNIIFLTRALYKHMLLERKCSYNTSYSVHIELNKYYLGDETHHFTYANITMLLLI